MFGRDVAGGLRAFGLRFFRVGGDVAEQFAQGGAVRFGPERIIYRRHVADVLFRHALRFGGDEITIPGVSEIESRAEISNDSWLAAGHRFRNRQAVSLAPVRMCQAVTRGVQTSQFRFAHVLIDIYNVRAIGLGLQCPNQGSRALIGIKAVRAEVLDNQYNRVLRRKRPVISVQQYINPLSRNRAANEQELIKLRVES